MSTSNLGGRGGGEGVVENSDSRLYHLRFVEAMNRSSLLLGFRFLGACCDGDLDVAVSALIVAADRSDCSDRFDGSDRSGADCGWNFLVIRNYLSLVQKGWVELPQ